MEAAELRKIISDQNRCLNGFDLSWSDLRNIDLRRAGLGDANLSGANLRGADLERATLSRANLRYAILASVNLRAVWLQMADLTGADLTGADLSGASLAGADLTDADLTDADLTGTTLDHAKMVNCQGVEVLLHDSHKITTFNPDTPSNLVKWLYRGQPMYNSGHHFHSFSQKDALAYWENIENKELGKMCYEAITGQIKELPIVKKSLFQMAGKWFGQFFN